MPTFWPRLLLLCLAWLVLVLHLPSALLPAGLLVSALYLAGYFVSQLGVVGRSRSVGRGVAYLAGVGALMLVSPYTPSTGLVLLATLLLATLLVDEAVSSLMTWWAPAVSVAAAVGSVVTATLLLRQDGSVAELALLGLVVYLIGAVTVAFRRLAVERREGTDRYGALLSEYRDLKRVSAASADAARAEERISVARRLHDSVGQRLTSLLMQLEVSRLGAQTDEQRQRAVDLKRLAQASLDETREAVTALTEDELAGMPALLRLVHNLEVESAMQVEFTIGSGALSVQLDREPAVALYRAVQEALTNAMRHGASRRARVTVEVPAGRLLRFEVWNEVPRGRRTTELASSTVTGSGLGESQRFGGDADSEADTGQPTFRPGFGLTSMRERVEAAGGQLEVVGGSGQFLVRGSFPLEA